MRSIEAQKDNDTRSRTGRLELARKMETGFPSPASDHLEKALNLEELVVFRPSATFYVRAQGNAMQRSGIHDKDILIVDRSITPRHGNIIVTSIDEEPSIRRFAKQGSRIFLVSDDPSLQPIAVNKETAWTIWGVVTHVIHRFRLEEG
ncbi:MAG: translesion error-prone DNA polymerase V autoproteolytic subunit [Balneola sp.]|nr:translesion error-prone DNA polymerase V autoproteolytic subunit [Balneola sp.]MBO6649568.1 translesion error-prone DNA polymerase V autoproteolytic subunit [Balneola sp.]MBO6711385.1 translesion error-prone DNA polymerase V autoproteolytic subunit [Balneola sp.]MBO6801261.1 translesion error-prone DNA polymerase V autoproteolytic subunit [Balneola sp.]MBO6869321.1 translesion error-prone DNA polymerase V autoproteolytic subunit [Balneola sp.]